MQLDKKYTRGVSFSQEEEINNAEVTNGYNKLDVYNWLEDINSYTNKTDIIEVRFKNTRKGYYQNVNKLKLSKGDIVSVEASPGHDMGIVSLTGHLVYSQLKKNNIQAEISELKKIYRKARPADLKKWFEAIELEIPSMLKTREFAEKLELEMKIGDVEYQGDKTKAIFYYIADERVDFRELIKIMAEEFKVRIEMRQIGARQEAGRIGGIGPCGRELCCSAWMSNFVSVVTNAARYQELSLNPQKLAGQCSKLKCCLNYELGCYMDARKEFPDISIPIETSDGKAYHQKTDVFRKIMWYSFEGETSENLIALSVDRVSEIIELNKKGEIAEKIVEKNDTDKSDFSLSQKELSDYTNNDDYVTSRLSVKKKSKKAFHKKDNSQGNNKTKNTYREKRRKFRKDKRKK